MAALVARAGLARTAKAGAAHDKVSTQRAKHMRVEDPAQASTHEEDTEMLTAEMPEGAADDDVFDEVELGEPSSLHENSRALPSELSGLDAAAESQVQASGDLYSLD